MEYPKKKYEPEKLQKGYGSGYKAAGYKERAGIYKTEEGETLSHGKVPRLEYEPKRVNERIVISTRMVGGLQDESIKPLRLVSEELIGGIFDRVIFLQSRIGELNSSIDVRKQIHQSILGEIEKDIEDRESFMRVVSDINEKRNIKLDISVLRKERRHEDVQFWRDLVELSTELRKLTEELEIESRIVAIFEGMEKRVA